MSQDFSQLITTKTQVRALLEGSSFHSDDFSLWELARKFIAQAINHPGNILDIGCGNGFLLRCLQEWQPNTLTPYGVDTNPEFISQAKNLFSDCPQNFTILSVGRLQELSKTGLPNQYDFVYWNVWDNWNFDTSPNVDVFKQALSLVSPKGRLILGFYHQEKNINLSKIEQLKNSGFIPQEIEENSSERNEVVCWFEK